MRPKFEFYNCSESVDRSIILNEAARRGINIDTIPGSTGHYVLDLNGHRELIGYLNTSLLGMLAGRITKIKGQTKYLLQTAGINVPRGKVFVRAQRELILPYIDNRSVVVKPDTGSSGKNVWVDVSGQDALKFADFIWDDGEEGVLIEDYFPWNEYRVFATTKGFVAAAQRVPANVVGDGKKSLVELVEEKNKSRGPSYEGYVWCPIILDDIVLNNLAGRGIGLDYVLPNGETLLLRKNSNLSTGGDSVAFSNDNIDPEVISLADRVLKAIPGMAYAGIDLMCRDIRRFDDYVVIEVNKSPGMTNHHFPNEGEPQNAAGALIDQLFPETAEV